MLAIASCRSGDGSYARLADYEPKESSFLRDACLQAGQGGVARVSVIQIGGRQLNVVQPDLCGTNRKKSAKLGLEEGEDQRKPVYIHYGFAGNAEEDNVIHRGRRDILPWASANYRVVDVSGMSISQAQQSILADRKRNPQDYSKESHVLIDIDAHGMVTPSGDHVIARSDVAPGVSSLNSYRTVDVQQALLEGVGHNAGNVVCAVQSCFSGAVQQDPQFQQIRNSHINPDQKRVFVFSAAPDRVAMTAPNSGVEQTMQLLTQSANPEKGLTVGEFQKTLEQKNLGFMKENFDIQTIYYPSIGYSTDTPIAGVGGVSHYDIQSTFNFEAQGPTVVGEKDSLLLPPGIGRSDTSPVLSREDHLQRIQQNTAGN